MLGMAVERGDVLPLTRDVGYLELEGRISPATRWVKHVLARAAMVAVGARARL